MASQTFNFRLETCQADFDDICAIWNFTEPLNHTNLENIFNPLLKKLYHKLLSQLNSKMNESSNENKQLLIQYWKQNYEDLHQSQSHCNHWLEILKQATSNEQYSIQQCVHTFNNIIASSAMDDLNHVLHLLNNPSIQKEYIQTQTHSKPINNDQISDVAALPLGWIKLSDDCYYNYLTSAQQQNAPTHPKPQLKKSKAASFPYPAVINQLRNSSSKSTREHILTDGVTLFKNILHITDANMLQKELSNDTNWDLLVDEIYTNLNPSQHKTVFETLKQITEHLFEDDDRFRRIYTDNEKIQKGLLNHRGGYEFLYGVGFKKVSKVKLICNKPDFDIVAAAFSAVNRKYEIMLQMMHNMKDNDDMKCNESMKDDMMDLIKRIKVFNSLYDDKILKEMHRISGDLLPTEKELKNAIFCMRTFVCTLSDVESYISSVHRPNISTFAEWDIGMIMKWIESLENGRFGKYSDVLRKGFISDEITAVLLPSISSNHLRDEPFNITNFSDRNSLVGYFRSLENEKQCGQHEGYQGIETECI